MPGWPSVIATGPAQRGLGWRQARHNCRSRLDVVGGHQDVPTPGQRRHPTGRQFATLSGRHQEDSFNPTAPRAVVIGAALHFSTASVSQRQMKRYGYDLLLDPGRPRRRGRADLMPPRIGNIALDCDDVLEVARFWSAALDRPLDPASDSEFASIGGDDADAPNRRGTSRRFPRARCEEPHAH